MGVIISTLLIQFYGWTGFDPIASLFIAVLIAASVIPLVIDSGKVLCLDVSDEEQSIESALKEVRLSFDTSLHPCPDNAFEVINRRRPLIIFFASILAGGVC